MDDKDSHEFLLSLGFKKTKNGNDAIHVFYELEGIITLKFFRCNSITTIRHLIQKIVDQSYELGQSDGSEQAYKKISNKLHEFIYSE